MGARLEPLYTENGDPYTAQMQKDELGIPDGVAALIKADVDINNNAFFVKKRNSLETVDYHELFITCNIEDFNQKAIGSRYPVLKYENMADNYLLICEGKEVLVYNNGSYQTSFDKKQITADEQHRKFFYDWLNMQEGSAENAVGIDIGVPCTEIRFDMSRLYADKELTPAKCDIRKINGEYWLLTALASENHWVKFELLKFGSGQTPTEMLEIRPDNLSIDLLEELNKAREKGNDDHLTDSKVRLLYCLHTG